MESDRTDVHDVEQEPEAVRFAAEEMSVPASRSRSALAEPHPVTSHDGTVEFGMRHCCC